MTQASTGLTARLQALRSDRLMVNSALIVRDDHADGRRRGGVLGDRSPAGEPEEVGLAGSLVSSGTRSRCSRSSGSTSPSCARCRPAAARPPTCSAHACSCASAGIVFALVYVVLLPLTSPRLQRRARLAGDHRALLPLRRRRPRVNVLSDSVFLAINRVTSYLELNGILLGIASARCRSCSPAPAPSGSTARSVARSCSARCASVWVILRHVPGRRTCHRRPSSRLAAVRRRRLRDLRALRDAAARLPDPGDQLARVGRGSGAWFVSSRSSPCRTR